MERNHASKDAAHNAERGLERSSGNIRNNRTNLGNANFQVMTRIQGMMANYEKNRTELEIANYRMNQVNLMLNVSNYARTEHLSNQQSIIRNDMAKGFQLVNNIQRSLALNQQRVSILENNISSHESQILDINGKVDRMKEVYGDKLKQHQKLLSEQRLELIKMTMSMFKQDLTIDSGILLLTWIIIKSPVVKYPISLLSFVGGAVPLVGDAVEKNDSRVMKRFMKIFIMFYIARAIRKRAIQQGWHNAVGTPKGYLSGAVNALGDFVIGKSSESNTIGENVENPLRTEADDEFEQFINGDNAVDEEREVIVRYRERKSDESILSQQTQESTGET